PGGELAGAVAVLLRQEVRQAVVVARVALEGGGQRVELEHFLPVRRVERVQPGRLVPRDFCRGGGLARVPGGGGTACGHRGSQAEGKQGAGEGRLHRVLRTGGKTAPEARCDGAARHGPKVTEATTRSQMRTR